MKRVGWSLMLASWMLANLAIWLALVLVCGDSDTVSHPWLIYATMVTVTLIGTVGVVGIEPEGDE